MTLTKRPREAYIEPMPTCESCEEYSGTLTEGISGAPSGLLERCRRRQIDISKNRTGCMLHTRFLDDLNLDTPFNPLPTMPNDYDIVSAVEYKMKGNIQEVVTAYAMGAGKGLAEDGAHGIINIVRDIVEVILGKILNDEIIPSMQSHLNNIAMQFNAYVEQTIEARRKEPTSDVQDNGEE